jgi:hypothetical protein
MSIANGEGLWANCKLPFADGLAWKVREITCGDDWEEGLHSEEIAQLKAQQFAGKSFDFGV